MNEDMELTRRTWIAAVKLAVVLSTIAAVVAIAVSSTGVSDTVIIAAVAVVAFAASWVQTGRVRNSAARPAQILVRPRSSIAA